MDKWTSILTGLFVLGAFAGLTYRTWKVRNRRRDRESAEKWARNENGKTWKP